MKRYIIFIVFITFITTLISPSFLFAEKICPKCGTVYPDSYNYCDKCIPAVRLISVEFGEEDLQEAIGYWTTVGDVTIEEKVMRLSHNTVGKETEFKTTASASIGDTSWTDYKVSFRLYMKPNAENSSRCLLFYFRNNPRAEYLGGGGQVVLLLQAGKKPAIFVLKNEDKLAIKSKFIYESGYKIKSKGDIIGGSILMLIGAIDLGIVFKKMAKEADEPVSKDDWIFLGLGIDCAATGGIFAVSGAKKDYYEFARGYPQGTCDYTITSERWVTVVIEVKKNWANIYFDGELAYAINDIPSLCGGIKIESIDGCTAYIDDMVITDLSGK